MVVTKEQLLAILNDIQAGLEANDSFEGSFTYTCLQEDLKPGEFEVKASYRIGNSMGQGGVALIK